MTVNLVRGGAIQHVQLAGLIFTNTAATACTLLGYPFAQLMRGGRTLGRPAQHQGPVGPGVVLTRNVGAEAQLEATTDCQAPLSDHVRVRAPGLSQSADLADTLRACTLTVSAVHRS